MTKTGKGIRRDITEADKVRVTDKSPTTEMVLVPVQPLYTPEQAAEAWKIFLELKQKLLDKSDYQMIAGKQFIKKSGFRKLIVAFNLTDRILEQERVEREDETFYWRMVVECEADNGRKCTGVGICDSAERNFAHVEHDVYATAHTRAKNRAISDMVAGGIVSAEEMANEPPERPKTERKTTKAPQEVRAQEHNALAKVKLKKGQTWDNIFKEFAEEIQTRQEQLGELWSFEAAAVVFAREKGLVKNKS